MISLRVFAESKLSVIKLFILRVQRTLFILSIESIKLFGIFV
jgi:hypothetical protein